MRSLTLNILLLTALSLCQEEQDIADTTEAIQERRDPGQPHPVFRLFSFGLNVVGGAARAVHGAAGAVHGALDNLDIERRVQELPRLPNPFQVAASRVSITRVTGDNEKEAEVNDIAREKVGELVIEDTTLALEPEGFCGQAPSERTLGEVVADLVKSPSLSIFAGVLRAASANTSSQINDTSVTILAPSNEALEKLDKPLLDLLLKDASFAVEFLKKHTLSDAICCGDIVRNSGPFFNNNRRETLAGDSVALRRSHSGSLYAKTSEIDRKQCSLVFENGVLLVLNKVL